MAQNVTQTSAMAQSARDVLTTRGRAFVAAGLTLLIGGLLLGFADITRVGVLLAVLPLLAGLSARRTRRTNHDIVVVRTVNPARVSAGQKAGVTVVLKNTSHRRTLLQLGEERVPPALADRPRFLLPPMDPGDTRRVDYQIRSQIRGRYRLGPLTLRRRDPYGLAMVAMETADFAEILVLPQIETLGRGHPRADGLGAEGAIPHMVAQHGEDDVAVRSYRDGDDLRRIHWPATAHRSELMVRQEDHPARRRAVILLDSRTAGHQGTGAGGSFEWAVTAAASIASHLAAHHYTIHLASRERAAEGQAAGAVEIDEALASLATAELSTSAQFDDVLGWAHALTSTGGLALAIATDQDHDALRRIAALRQPGVTGLLILLDTATFATPRPAGQSGPASPTAHAIASADIVSAAGWTTCVVTSGMTVRQAWDVVAAANRVLVGDGR
jgi:uncharacterized protein (DUF58 family)